MKKTSVLLLFVLLLFTNSVFAQTPELKIGSRVEKPVYLGDLSVAVRIFGHLAETTMKMKFINPNSRVLEGELELPMPEGAVVSGYALDVNGVMIDGVAIEKQKAREVFEAEVRKGIDPGIIEKVKGNNFKTRIYPIPASGYRIAQVTYITSLEIDDAEAVYRLPLQLTRDTAHSTLRVEVLSVDKKPSVSLDGVAAIDFSRQKSGWFFESEIKAVDLKAELKVVAPVPETGAVFVEKASDGNSYFSIQDYRRRPLADGKTRNFKKVVVLYDASGSAEKRNRDLEMQFLEKFFSSERVAPEFELEIVEFRNSPAEPVKFSLQRGNIVKLADHLSSVRFDGGTSFYGLEKHVNKAADCVLLLSDGISTYGKSNAPSFDKPVFAVSSVAGSDFSFLSAVCRKTGGRLINLNVMPIHRAVEAAGADFFGVVAKKHGREIADILPEGSVAASPEFMLVGRIDGDAAEIELSFGSGKVNNEKKTYVIDRSKAVEGDFLRRYWAGRKVEELMSAKDKNRPEIISLSKKHGIVNEFTSLIVLERIEQYLEHRIVPPATMPKWRDEYFKVVESEAATLEKTRSTKLETVIGMWERRLSWWETDFSKAPQPVKMDKKSMRDLSAPGSAMSESLSRSDSFDRESLEDSAMPQSANFQEMAVGGAPSPSALAASSEEKEKSQTVQRSVNPGVAVKAWEPDARYARQIKQAADPMAEYFAQKSNYGNAPSFYLDCADIFIALERPQQAVQILSNIAELELENPALLRVLAHRLAQLEHLEVSADIFAEVLEMRKEEPQSYRDLALVLGRMGEYKRSAELLYEVVLKEWDGRFPEIEVIALEELNNIIQKGKRAGVDGYNVDSRLLKPIDVDLRIVMTWDADLTDMDLWVYEPRGEAASYQNPRTAAGGLVSRDFTRGYGPEEYMIRKALTGTYEVKTKFYGSNSQKVAGAVTLQVDIFTNYGRENEKRRSVTLRLTENKETFTVAEIEF